MDGPFGLYQHPKQRITHSRENSSQTESKNLQYTKWEVPNESIKHEMAERILLSGTFWKKIISQNNVLVSGIKYISCEIIDGFEWLTRWTSSWQSVLKRLTQKVPT